MHSLALALALELFVYIAMRVHGHRLSLYRAAHKGWNSWCRLRIILCLLGGYKGGEKVGISLS